jgi:hypothetical protein
MPPVGPVGTDAVVVVAEGVEIGARGGKAFQQSGHVPGERPCWSHDDGDVIEIGEEVAAGCLTAVGVVLVSDSLVETASVRSRTIAAGPAPKAHAASGVWMSAEACDRAATLRALRLVEAVSMRIRPLWKRNMTGARRAGWIVAVARRSWPACRHGAVGGGERPENLVGVGADAPVHLVGDPFEERGALDFGGHERVDGRRPIGTQVGAGGPDLQPGRLDDAGEPGFSRMESDSLYGSMW